MNGSTKLILLCCAAVVCATLIYRSDIALQPALPKNMPADSRFIATGYDLEHNEHKGVWIACHPGRSTGVSFCRITDNRGIVVFQGDYVPVRDAARVRAEPSAATPATGHLGWVTGPVEGISVPLIPMTDGTLLVPEDDRDALLARWNQHPEQWEDLTRSE